MLIFGMGLWKCLGEETAQKERCISSFQWLELKETGHPRATQPRSQNVSTPNRIPILSAKQKPNSVCVLRFSDWVEDF